MFGKIDGKELTVKKGKSDWTGWIPKSDVENRNSQN